MSKSFRANQHLPRTLSGLVLTASEFSNTCHFPIPTLPFSALTDHFPSPKYSLDHSAPLTARRENPSSILESQVCTTAMASPRKMRECRLAWQSGSLGTHSQSVPTVIGLQFLLQQSPLPSAELEPTHRPPTAALVRPPPGGLFVVGPCVRGGGGCICGWCRTSCGRRPPLLSRFRAGGPRFAPSVPGRRKRRK